MRGVQYEAVKRVDNAVTRIKWHGEYETNVLLDVSLFLIVKSLHNQGLQRTLDSVSNVNAKSSSSQPSPPPSLVPSC